MNYVSRAFHHATVVITCKPRKPVMLSALLFQGLITIMANAGFAATSAPKPLAAAPKNPVQCQLFPDGAQDLSDSPRRVSRLKSVLMECRNAQGLRRIATRTMKVNKVAFVFLVDPDSLETSIERDPCWSCQHVDWGAIADTRFAAAADSQSKNYKIDKKNPAVLTNAGLTRFEKPETKGSAISADLCPSVKDFSRDFFIELESLQKNVPVALAISGFWLKRHKNEFRWLKEQVSERAMSITWVNHTYRHPFSPGEPKNGNFLLKAGTNLDFEIIENERILIENGVTPAVFFRFPGLISDVTLLGAIHDHGLIPLGASAWLAIGQKADNGSIILVHGNGNEPLGIARFSKLVKEKKLPLPLLRVSDAPLPP